MLAPLAPHLAEELWERLGNEDSLAYVEFPTADPQWLTVETVEIAVQLNGKVRARVTVDAGLDENGTEAAARGDAHVAELLDGATVRKVVVVPGRLVNFVLG
jgi:leucyl-tRNA synthetase